MRTGFGWRGLVCGLWASIVFIQYFFRGTHPVFGAFHYIPEFFRLPSDLPLNGFHPEEILKSFWIFLASLGVMVLTWSLGRRVRRWFGRISADPWVLVGLDMGLGIFFMGLWAFGAGANGLWFPFLWKGWLLGLFVWALVDLWHLRAGWRTCLRFEIPEPLLLPLL